MSEKRKESDPLLPDIETCPKCGQHLLIGDVICPHCGYNTQSTTDQIRSIPPSIIAVVLFSIGAMICLAALTGVDGVAQVAALVVGFGFIAGGGLYYAADLLYFNANELRDDPRRRK